MSLTKKSEVKNHLFARRCAALNTDRLVAKQDLSFTGDFSLEHSSPGGTITAVVIATSEDIQVSKSPRDPQR